MTTLTLPATRFTHLLVATDFSDESLRALTAAKAVARRFDAEISAVSVLELVNPVTVPEAVWYDSAEDRHQVEERMEQLTAELHSQGIKGKGLCTAGRVDGEILRTAKELGADLVVTGSHARLGADRWMYGSVAEDVARKAKVPL